MLSNETLVRKAHTAYGELITKIDLYPQGIHVHLIGFECVTYGTDGSWGASWRVPTRYMARIKFREMVSALRR